MPTPPESEASAGDPLPTVDSVPARAVHVLDDLEQLRALSDPLRMRILGALCGPPRTTKQVAEKLGEKPTRLYHHVEALVGAGLIRLVYTKPKRGTLEKYFQSVARRFQTDASLFPRSGGESEDSWPLVGAKVLEGTAADLRRLGPELAASEDMAAVLARVMVRADRKTLARTVERIQALIGELEELDDAESEEAFHLTVAIFPEPVG